MQGGEDAVDDADDEPPYEDDISLRRFLSIGQLVLQLFSPLATVVIIALGKGEVFRTVLVAIEVVVVVVLVAAILVLVTILEFISFGDEIGKEEEEEDDEEEEEEESGDDTGDEEEFNT